MITRHDGLRLLQIMTVNIRMQLSTVDIFILTYQRNLLLYGLHLMHKTELGFLLLPVIMVNMSMLLFLMDISIQAIIMDFLTLGFKLIIRQINGVR